MGRTPPQSRTISLPVLSLLFIPVWLLNFTGINVTGYSIISYFAMFLIGYYLLAMDPVQVNLEKFRAVLLAAWIVLTIGVMWTYGMILGHYEVFWGVFPRLRSNRVDGRPCPNGCGQALF